MHAKLLLPMLMLSLSGCAAAGTRELLALKTYDAGVEARLLQELDAAPADSAWPAIVADYVALRDEVKACKGNADGK